MDQFIRDYENNIVNTVVYEDMREFSLNVRDIVDGSFKIFHNNIRSLSQNFEQLQVVLHDLEYDFDCLVLTETFQLDNLALFHIEGYDLVYNGGIFNKNDGIVFYLKNNLDYNFEIVQVGQCSVLKVLITLGDARLQVTGVYKSPTIPIKEFDDSFHEYLRVHCRNDICHVIVGDFNINILEDSLDVLSYLNVLSEEDFVSVVNKPTRVQGNSSSCIDHMLVKSIGHYTPIIVKNHITDHFSTILFVKLSQPISRTRGKKNRFGIDYQILKSKLDSLDWTVFFQIVNPEKLADLFIEKVQFCVRSSQYKVRCRKRKRKPWITNNILSAIETRNMIYKE